jgi:hypothetical protein
MHVCVVSNTAVAADLAPLCRRWMHLTGAAWQQAPTSLTQQSPKQVGTVQQKEQALLVRWCAMANDSCIQ